MFAPPVYRCCLKPVSAKTVEASIKETKKGIVTKKEKKGKAHLVLPLKRTGKVDFA